MSNSARQATSGTALVIVSGAPGTGKTTLAMRLASSLRIPYLGKDFIKESLFDSLGVRDREWSMKLGIASIELLFKLIESHLEVGQSLVAESNFRRDYDVPRFNGLSEKYDLKIVEIHCATETQVLRTRLERRDRLGDRHAGHETANMLDEIDRLIADGTFGPLAVSDAVLQVDMTDFDTVDYHAVISAAGAASSLLDTRSTEIHI